MRLSVPAALCTMTLLAGLVGPAAADPWIAGVKPRLIGRGGTAEIVIDRWGHEAQGLVFYPPVIGSPKAGQSPATGIRCVSTQFDESKKTLTCQLEVAADCQPGEHPFRVLTAAGISTMGTVLVSPFPVVDEAEAKANSNDTPETALVVEPNVTVRGTLSNSAADDIDCFRVVGKAGQRLSVEVEMVSMGDDLNWNPVPEGYDSVVAILDASGHKIAGNDDSPLNRQDPLVAVKLPADGEYTVVLRRAMFVPQTREYAIHIGRFARPLAAFPTGGPAGSELEVQLLGDPLGTMQSSVTVPQTVGTFPLFGEAPSPLVLRSCPFPNLLEAADADETRVSMLPVAVNGILAKPDETDRYRLTVEKDVPLQVRVWAAALGSPVDPRIRIRPIDAAGEPSGIELEADDASYQDRDIFGGHGDFPDTFDPSVIWTPKQSGDYLLEISDPRGTGGPTHVYRVEIAPPVNTLHVGLSWEDYKPERPRKTSLSIPQGGRWTVNLSLYPGQGSSISGPIDLAVSGLPPGLQALTNQLPSLQKTWPLTLVAEPDAPIAASLIQIEAKPTDAETPLTTINQQNLQRVSYSHYPWRNIRVDRFAAAVSRPAGFAVALEMPKQPLMRGAALTIPVLIERQPGFDQPLEVQCELAPPGVGTPAATIIPSGESRASLTLTATTSTRLGSGPLYVMVTTVEPSGKMGGDNVSGAERVRVSSEVVNLTVADPFVALSSEPQSVRRGERLAYRWKVKQLQPFAGTARVSMLGLPVGVTAIGPPPTIDTNTSDVTVELEARDEALLGMVGELTCELEFTIDGEGISLRTGNGRLRIDPRRE